MNYTVTEKLNSRTIEDELFILNRPRANIHSFNPTGTFIWKQLIQNVSTDQIGAALMEEFDVSHQQATEDLFSFMMELNDNGLITITAQ